MNDIAKDILDKYLSKAELGTRWKLQDVDMFVDTTKEAIIYAVYSGELPKLSAFLDRPGPEPMKMWHVLVVELMKGTGSMMGVLYPLFSNEESVTKFVETETLEYMLMTPSYGSDL